MKYLKNGKNKCRCGKPANCIFQITSSGNVKFEFRKVYYLKCDNCGLEYKSPECKKYLLNNKGKMKIYVKNKNLE